MRGAIVKDFRTLNALERAGYILCNGTPRSRERHWAGAAVRVITVQAGPKLENWYQPFTHRGVEYRIEYFDGCFHPFVVRAGLPKPRFV